LRSWQSLS